MINKSDKLYGQLLVASDVHMQDVGDPRGELLLDLIARIDPARTEVFLLNGDIFDFCFGKSPYYRAKFRPLGAALETLAAAGTRVVFVEGNHEFAMGAIDWRGVEVRKEKNFLLELGDGARIRITHGDLLIDDRLYRIFRWFVKSGFLAACALLVPGRWLDALTLRYAKSSRAQDQYRTLDHQKILGAFNVWLDEGAFDHGIIGHFHVPYGERRTGAAGLMVSVDSWDKPNALVFDGGVFSRVFLEKTGAPFRARPVRSHFEP